MNGGHFAKRVRSVPGRCRGNVTIEFALLFIPFFAMFYAVVSYGLVMMLVESMTFAAQEGARAAVALNPNEYADTATYISSGVVPTVQTTVADNLDWLPAAVREKVLGTGNANVAVSVNGSTLTVTVSYANYRAAPLVPVLTLPGIGDVPNVPADLTATAKIEL